MQNTRGLVYFNELSLNKIKSTLRSFKLDKLKFAFFDSLYRYNKNINKAGVFIYGQVDKEYTSKDIVNILQKQVGAKDGLSNCDVSIELEDTLNLITNGEIYGNYVGIRIKQPYKLNHIYKLASKIEAIIESSNTLVRTVESENDKPSVCIDLIIKKEYLEYRDRIENILNSGNVNLGKYTFAELK